MTRQLDRVPRVPALRARAGGGRAPSCRTSTARMGDAHDQDGHAGRVLRACA